MGIPADSVLGVFRAAGLFILVLVPLVVIHELGHFLAAKAFGIKVLEFAIGFPPRIKGLVWRRGETEYTINWLPLGGFVRLLGEEDPSDPRSLAAAPRWKRFIVLSAGVWMNVVLAVVLMSASFMIPRERSLSLAQVTSVAPGSPAAEARIEGVMPDGSPPARGLQPGDIVLKVEGRDIANVSELIYASRLHLGRTQEWVIKRGGALLKAYVYARWHPPAGQGPTGITVGPPMSCSGVDDQGNPTNCQLIYPFTERVALPPWEAVPKGVRALLETVQLSINELRVRLGGGGGAATEDQPVFTGPVGIADTTNQVVSEAGWRALIELAALLSLSLAVFNFIPWPGLDGGRVLMLGIEVLRGGKRLSPEVEGLIHFAGMAALLSLVAIVTYFDIARLVT